MWENALQAWGRPPSSADLKMTTSSRKKLHNWPQWQLACALLLPSLVHKDFLHISRCLQVRKAGEVNRPGIQNPKCENNLIELYTANREATLTNRKPFLTTSWLTGSPAIAVTQILKQLIWDLCKSANGNSQSESTPPLFTQTSFLLTWIIEKQTGEISK